MATLRNGLDSKIVIVGCGISGIGAARSLIKHGFRNVRIIEATARSGGRIKTGRLGNNIVEIGANWIHGPSKENPVFCLACQYDLLEPESKTEENQSLVIGGHLPFVPNCFSSLGRKLSPELLQPAIQLFSGILEECQKFHADGGEPVPSVGEFVRAEFHRRMEMDARGNAAPRALWLAALSTQLKAECCISGTHSMDEVGLGAFGAYKTLPGLDCTFPRGYERLVDCMMEELPEGIVSYGKPVKCVRWNGSATAAGPAGIAAPVVVECEDGEALPADHVILTIPLGYLKKHQTTLLHPPLPLRKAHSIQRMGFGTNNKIFLEFEAPFWDTECEIIFLFWEEEVEESGPGDVVPDVERFWMKKLFGFTVLKPTERYGHVLCGWIAGHESEHMESLSDLEVQSSITQLIRRFTGNPTITPKRVLRSRWYHEPYTCGSYSYLANGCSVQDIDNLAEPLPVQGSHPKPLQVLFAGEATHGCFFSTVHGALLSGWREAERLIALHTPSPSSSQVTSKL